MRRQTNLFLMIAALAAVLAWSATAGASAQHIGGHDPRALNADPRQATGPIAPVLSGLGDHHHPVSTNSKQAQYFFDQGLRLTYGFNPAFNTPFKRIQTNLILKISDRYLL